MYKKLLSLALLSSLLSLSCTQPGKKSVDTAQTASTKVKGKSKGAACCVNKVPSRFAIVKNDSVTLKSSGQ